MLTLKTVFVAIEGFNNLSQGYIIKELSIVYLDNTYQHYQFKSPEEFIPTNADMKIINYCKKYLNGFSLEDNFYLPNHLHNTIIGELLDFKIYVAGNTTKSFICDILPTNVVMDVTSLIDFQYPEALPDPHCFKPHGFNNRYCSLSKARFLKKRMDELFFRDRCSYS